MKIFSHVISQPRTVVRLATLASMAILLTACASSPPQPNPAAAIRTRLNLLQANPALASLAPIEIQSANAAVTAAEKAGDARKQDPVLTGHLVLIAGQKVDIAAAWAQSRLYEDQREELSALSEAARLESRTREADRARSDATLAQNQTQVARNQADVARSQTQVARNDANAARTATGIAQDQSAIARNDADAARTDTAIAQGQTSAARNQTAIAQGQANAARNQTAIAQGQTNAARNQTELARADTQAARAETDELQRQITELNARNTDRGLVVTLGDVLFETGKSNLLGGSAADLDRLAGFLKRYDSRSVRIEGYTDNVGTDESNISLSQRRAASVQSYLVNQGVGSSRISVAGLGEERPVSSNDSDTGRQQNRRVEVIISNLDL